MIHISVCVCFVVLTFVHVGRLIRILNLTICVWFLDELHTNQVLAKGLLDIANQPHWIPAYGVHFLSDGLDGGYVTIIFS